MKNKIEYPSVTQILSPWSGYDRIPEHRLEAAAERGTIVHTHCAAYALCQWSPPPQPEYQSYIDSFKRWFDMFIDETLVCEEELVDHALGYMGHPDLGARSKKLGGNLLIDLKTPVQLHRKIWGSQLAAYKNLLRVAKGIEVDRIGSLQLSSLGAPAKYTGFTGNIAEYFKAFYSALICYKFYMED